MAVVSCASQVIDRVVSLTATMQREVSLIREFNLSYALLRTSVEGRNWVDLQRVMKECERLSQDIFAVEERRYRILSSLYSLLKLPEERDFLEMTQYFPSNLRSEAKRVYFVLRTEFYRMQCRLKSLEIYARVRVELVRAVMDRAQALQLTGSPYMRAGRRAMHDPDSFLFDSVK